MTASKKLSSILLFAMKIPAALFLCGTFVVPFLWSQDQQPTIEGYVTRVDSNSDFDVDGLRVICGTETQSFRTTGPGEMLSNDGCPRVLPYIGEPVSIFGSIKRKKGELLAGKVILKSVPPCEVSGEAVIDALPPREAPSGQHTLLIRADGYRILLTGATKIVWSQNLRALDDVRPGDWIRYRGRLDNFGLLVAGNASLAHDAVSVREEKLRAKNEYDPAAVPADASQGTLGRKLGGYDPKKIAPYKDPAMQARIEAIGNKLVPAYQRAFSDSDPAKIHFRFQLISGNGLSGALALPSGIVLVPHQTVERMQNDSQLAAVLADKIASILEKQQYRTQPEREMAGAVTAGGILPVALRAAPFAAPFVIAGEAGMSAIDEKMLEQSGRVSLDLLEAAGYDIHQAPVAWWLLASKNQRPLIKIPLPERAAYLYRMLGEEWRKPAAGGRAAAKP